MEPAGPRRLPDDEAASWTAEWRAVHQDEPFGQEDGWQRHPGDPDDPQGFVPPTAPAGSAGPDWPAPVTSLSDRPGMGGAADWPAAPGANPHWEPDAGRGAPPGDLTGGWDAPPGADPGRGGAEDWPAAPAGNPHWEPDAGRGAPPGDTADAWHARPDPGWPEPVGADETTGTWFTTPDREWRSEETSRAVHPTGDALDDWRSSHAGPDAPYHGGGGQDAWQGPHGGGAPLTPTGMDGGFPGDTGPDWQGSRGGDPAFASAGADDGFRAGEGPEGWREHQDNAPGGWDRGDGFRDSGPDGWQGAGPGDARPSWSPAGAPPPADAPWPPSPDAGDQGPWQPAPEGAHPWQGGPPAPGEPTAAWTPSPHDDGPAGPHSGPADQETGPWTPEWAAHPGDRLVYSNAGPPPETQAIGHAAGPGPSFPDRPRDDDDYDWDDPDESPRKRLVLVLLSAAAAVLVLGGTVAGIHFITRGNGQAVASCAPGDNCARVTPSAPEPVAETTPSAESEDTEEPEETEEAEPEPEPEPEQPTTRQTTAPEPRPTPERRPTPKRTKSTSPPRPQLTDQATPPADLEETEDTEVDEEQQELGVPTQDAPDAPPPDDPADPGNLNPFGLSAGGAVRVGFDVVSTAAARYTVELSVVNNTSETMSGVRLSIPVSGVVKAVEGDVEWSQKGGTLVLDYDRALPVGDRTSITFTALGTAESPTTCTIPRTRCRLT